LDFILEAATKSLPHHIAQKVIPFVDSMGNTITPKSNNGWKFELFAFDIFEYANRMLAFETSREDEFSPLKNSVHSPVDNPITCRLHLSDLHKKWVEAAGGKFDSSTSNLFEISPLISYFGEDLSSLAGKTITLPFSLNKPLFDN